jgi:hypothetical protein
MSRRARLPGADELFRATAVPAAEQPEAVEPVQTAEAEPAVVAPPAAPVAPVTHLAAVPAARQEVGEQATEFEPDEMAEPVREPLPTPRAARPRARATSSRTTERRPSGRERHDEKITVYVSADELIDLEHARLALRREHGLAIDRGRIVREALAVVLADLEAKGEQSILVRRLRGH